MTTLLKNNVHHLDSNGDYEMTTTVKVSVNGKYRATVTQDSREPVVVEGNYNGGSGEKYFNLSHPANSTFVISEEYVKDGDERPVA